MIIPDVNLLLYAVVTGFAQHERAREWWEGCLNGSGRVGLTQPAVYGFLRIATSARVLESPLSVDAASAYILGWLDQPNVSLLSPGPEHLRTTMKLLRYVGTAGNLTVDAQLAAYAIEHRGEVHSNDTDFARFPEVTWVNPLKGDPGRAQA